MIYFLNFQYSPNTASVSRQQAYYHALDMMGIKATVVYIHPDNYYNKIQEQFENINVEYYWKPYMLYRGIFRRITLRFYLQKFINRLKKGDIVYTYSVSLLTKLCVSVDGIRVFAELTEHPQASKGFLNPLLAISDNELYETLSKLTGLFVISRPLQQFYESMGLNPSKIHIINMFVDIERFKGVLKKPVEYNYIAYCGTASNNKDGVDQLLKAFAIVLRSHPEYKLYIIGSIPSNKERFENLELTRALGIENNVVFTGIVPATAVPQLLMNASLLALDRPNNLQAKFGFPTKLGEYLLTGNPVVITSVGDIPLFLKDGQTALLAEPDNPQSFAEKINWAIEYPHEAQVIGERGKQVAYDNFNFLKETKKLIDIIQCN